MANLVVNFGLHKLLGDDWMKYLSQRCVRVRNGISWRLRVSVSRFHEQNK